MVIAIIPIIRFLVPKSVTAIAIWPFILFKTKTLSTHKVILNHEKIHLQQQRELLVLPFYLIYFFEYFVLIIYYLNHDKAYRNISFEKEAYCFDTDLTYLQKRKPWAMWRNQNKTKSNK